MRGVGEATAAITLVNALPTGIGSAVGVELRARAEVELRPAGSRGRWDVHVPESLRTPLVVAALDTAFNRFAPGSAGTASVDIRSDIPAGRGLKSSSAVSSALVLAVAHATDDSPAPAEVARLSARAATAAGVSATGAFDDALAGLTNGVVVTDNREAKVLAEYPLPSTVGVAILVPHATHRPSPEWATTFRRAAEEGRAPVTAALSGDWAGAMRANTELVERIVGYDYRSVREDLARRGAISAGVSGMGPALAAIAPANRLADVMDGLPETMGRRLSLGFSGPRPARRDP